jgi:hypothetical protein
VKQTNQDKKEMHETDDKNVAQQKLNMVDLETALSYMLRREIPRTKEIQGESYDALVQWLDVLIKVCCYSYFSLSTINKYIQQSLTHSAPFNKD